MECLQEFINPLSNGTIPTPYGLPFPKIVVRTPPQTSIAISIISQTGEATDFEFGRYDHRVHPNNPLKSFEKRERDVGVFRDCQVLWVPPIISITAEATKFKFCMHIQARSEVKPIKIWGKVAMGTVRESRTFSRNLYIGRIARSSQRQLGLLVVWWLMYEIF